MWIKLVIELRGSCEIRTFDIREITSSKKDENAISPICRLFEDGNEMEGVACRCDKETRLINSRLEMLIERSTHFPFQV